MNLFHRLATGNHERLARGMEHQYRHDRVGVRLHLAFGLCWCFFLGWPVTWTEFMAAPLLFYGLLRLTNSAPIALVYLTRPLVLLVLAWMAWNLTTLAWTPDVRDGLNDMSKARFFLTASFLWPVMNHRARFIAALAAGFLVGNAVQFADVLGAKAGIRWLDWFRPEDRHSGWWKPAVGGSLLVAALGLHLPAAFMGRGRARWIAIVCAPVTFAGLLATGTRGGWIAGAGLVVLTGLVALARLVVRRRAPANTDAAESSADGGAPAARRTRPLRRAALIAVGTLAMIGAGTLAWTLVGESVMRRIELSRQEWRLAREQGDYSSFTGQRVLMWRLAVEAFTQNPLGGVGVGGYREWTTQRRAESPTPESTEARERRFPHAHNTLLHAAATTGLPGLALTILIIIVALRGALAREQLGPEGLGSYAAAPGFAMIGLLLVSAFDTLQVNAGTVALVAALLVMSLLPAPRTPAWAMEAGRPGPEV